MMQIALLLVPLFWTIVGAVLLIPLQFSLVSCGHNHCHCAFFKSKNLNIFIECILYFQTGISPHGWFLYHVLGHHEHYLDQELDTARWQKTDGSTMTRLYYTVKTTLRFYPEIVRVGRIHPKELKRFIIMLIFCNCILLVLLLLEPLKTLIVFIIPMLLILLLALEATYDHHAGRPTDNALEASNNNVNKTYNLLSWNLGFHTAHHLRPGLHWSKLPHFHNRISNQIPLKNIFDHLPFKSYFQRPESSHNPPSDI